MSQRSTSSDSNISPGSGQSNKIEGIGLFNVNDDLQKDMKLRGELIVGLGSLYTKHVVEGWKFEASNTLKSVFPTLPFPAPPPVRPSPAENSDIQRRLRSFSTGHIPYSPSSAPSPSTATPSSSSQNK
jgi:hypothetical protein